jgi:phosphoribosylanthranilate isomerase
VEAVSRPRVKICCIRSSDEARLAIRSGAAALGLVSQMPSGPGVISEERIAEIARQVPPPVASFLLTSLREPAEIVAQQQRLGTTTLQLCDEVEPDAHRELRAALPGIGIVQVVHVMGPGAVEEAARLARHVDALLLDSGDTRLAVKRLGGTGRAHDWRISRRIREIVDVPLFLAGGLTPENVAEAVREVAPFGVDVCSGVRTDGRLDPLKLARFFDAVAAA